MTDAQVCDYLVIGAGSAGCVMAARLSESGRDQVTVLEAGGSDRSFWIRTPLGYGLLFDDARINWLYESAPETELGNARIFQPRGRVLGGTSSINGMVYVRGQREDFDEWAALGNRGWGFDDLLPFFIKSEDNSRGASAFHGVGGPLAVSDIPRHELADAFVRAGGEAGYPLTDDFNGASQEGFGYNQLTVRDGRRCSAADAFLRPALGRPNLRLETDAVAQQLLFEGRRAVGVRYRKHGKDVVIKARREVVLCGGTHASPQLLQLSGIGPAALVAGLGRPVVADLPGVGENMQDHFTMAMLCRSKRAVTINDIYNSLPRRLAMGLQYLLTHQGLMATNASFCGAYIRSSDQVDRPDLKFNFALWGRGAAGRSKERLGLMAGSSFTPSVILLRPASRGTVRAVSPTIGQQPEIRFNFLKDEADQSLAVSALRRLRGVLAMPAMGPYLGEELVPGPAATSDEDLLDAIRKRGRSNQHAVGTCRMGSDTGAVVDDQLRVHGVGNLRVVDASIMPTIVSGNTNAAVIMIAEKAAHMITAGH